eukprot:m.45813 g.45813  ORF g.45813 m.45813 type:complete len:137 (-) comp8684_c0_seq1:102-512(-)
MFPSPPYSTGNTTDSLTSHADDANDNPSAITSTRTSAVKEQVSHGTMRGLGASEGEFLLRAAITMPWGALSCPSDHGRRPLREAKSGEFGVNTPPATRHLPSKRNKAKKTRGNSPHQKPWVRVILHIPHSRRFGGM